MGWCSSTSTATRAPLADDLGPLFAECEGLPVDGLAYSHRVDHDLAANWKTYTDNYAEGYHIPLVHPGLNREIVAKQYRVDVHDRYCVHAAPARTVPSTRASGCGGTRTLRSTSIPTA